MKKYVILSAMAVVLGTLGYVSLNMPVSTQETVQSVQKSPALPKTAQFSHPAWTDTMVFDSQNRAHRSSRVNETAKVIKHSDDKIVLSWDNWGVESFRRGQDGTYQLIQE